MIIENLIRKLQVIGAEHPGIDVRLANDDSEPTDFREVDYVAHLDCAVLGMEYD